MKNPSKILGVVLVAVAIGSAFYPDTPIMVPLLLGAFGIGLFFWGFEPYVHLRDNYVSKSSKNARLRKSSL